MSFILNQKNNNDFENVHKTKYFNQLLVSFVAQTIRIYIFF